MLTIFPTKTIFNITTNKAVYKWGIYLSDDKFFATYHLLTEFDNFEEAEKFTKSTAVKLLYGE